MRFARLGLGIVDEQHRFGVMQRAARCALRGGADGRAPHILLMTATPIPRTLAMTIYGDLDVSVLDELPPGRKPVRTLIFDEARAGGVYALVKRELDRGPAGVRRLSAGRGVREAEDLRDATTMARELARSDLRRLQRRPAARPA